MCWIINKIRPTVIALSLIAALAGCGNDAPLTISSPTVSPSTSAFSTPAMSDVMATPAVSTTTLPLGNIGLVTTTVMITATDFAFTPSTLVVAANQPFRIKLVNKGKEHHDLTIVAGPGVIPPTPDMLMPNETATADPMSSMSMMPEETATNEMQTGASLHLHAHPGEASTAVVTLKPGTYSFICSIGDHRHKGMTGSIVAR